MCVLQLRALQAKTPAEKIKNKKGGHRMWEDVFDLGEKIRSGNYTWEDLQLDDVDVRLKWAGLFHRKKRAAGTFMMRLKVRLCPLGIPISCNLLLPLLGQQGTWKATARSMMWTCA